MNTLLAAARRLCGLCGTSMFHSRGGYVCPRCDRRPS